MSVNVLVVSGLGLNGENEARHGFLMAGANVRLVPFLDLTPGDIRESHVILIPGGFSYGDNLGAGKGFAALLRSKTKLYSSLVEFVDSGRILAGICNGAQVLVALGIMQLKNPQITLTSNASGKYECRWVHVKAERESVWFKKGEVLHLPVGHGEGRYLALSGGIAEENVALRYCNKDGVFANGAYPTNPNGSEGDVAAVVGEGGNVIAIMPHPDRSFIATQDPNWPMNKRLGKGNGVFGDGFNFFDRTVLAAKKYL